MCCTRLAGNAGAKNRQKLTVWAPRTLDWCRPQPVASRVCLSNSQILSVPSVTRGSGRTTDMLWAYRHSAYNVLVCSAIVTDRTVQSFGLWTLMGRRKHGFNRIRQVAPMCPHRRAHWRHLANTIEPFVCKRVTFGCLATSFCRCSDG